MEKKSNLSLCLGFFIFLGIYGFFLRGLSESDSLYPRFVLILLTLLTVAMTLQIVMSKTDEYKASLFVKFQKAQFFSVMISGVVYLALINLLGYFTSTLLFVGSLLLTLGTTKKVSAIVALSFCIFIYIVFKVFLGVPVPRGIIF